MTGPLLNILSHLIFTTTSQGVGIIISVSQTEKLRLEWLSSVSKVIGWLVSARTRI